MAGPADIEPTYFVPEPPLPAPAAPPPVAPIELEPDSAGRWPVLDVDAPCELVEGGVPLSVEVDEPVDGEALIEEEPPAVPVEGVVVELPLCVVVLVRWLSGAAYLSGHR